MPRLSAPSRSWEWLGIALSILALLGSLAGGAYSFGELNARVSKLEENRADDLAAMKREYEEAKRRMQALMGFQAPIGGIVSLVLDGNESTIYETVPSNWVLCDGKLLDASHPSKLTEDQVDPRFWNRRLPDLRGCFLRGAADDEVVGQTGGADALVNVETSEVADHRHEVPRHDHGLPATTGSVANVGPDPGHHQYMVLDDHAQWTNSHHLSVSGGASTQEGQHRHVLGGRTEHAEGHTTSGGAHRHVISSLSVLPRHVRARFLMRIR